MQNAKTMMARTREKPSTVSAVSTIGATSSQSLERALAKVVKEELLGTCRATGGGNAYAVSWTAGFDRLRRRLRERE